MRFATHTYLIAFFVGIAALGAGVVAVFSAKEKDFARVEIKNTPFVAEVASFAEERARGLSGRKDFGSSHGMLFLFDRADFHSIWMRGMYFPIDILWIANGKIVDLELNVPPPVPLGSADTSSLAVYTSDVPAEFVFETRAGFIRDHNIHLGDPVKIVFQNIILSGGTEGKESSLELSPAGHEYFIETLRNIPPDGAGFQIKETLKETDAYNEYLISYVSDGLAISGVMNVPRGSAPRGGFPILILNHGLIHPSVYFPGRGSRREKDFFARHGYVTIHPDYRGLGESSPSPFLHHDFYAGYTRDVLNVIDAMKKSGLPLFDVRRIGMWGHSMGGGIAARVMVLSQDVRAYVLFAPISADAEDNFYELPEGELGWLGETYGIGEKASLLYKKMSPLEYFNFVEAPVQLHHGLEDKDVPIVFSEKMFSALRARGKKAEFFQYAGEPHEFIKEWPTAAERALQFFDLYVKGEE